MCQRENIGFRRNGRGSVCKIVVALIAETHCGRLMLSWWGGSQGLVPVQSKLVLPEFEGSVEVKAVTRCDTSTYYCLRCSLPVPCPAQPSPALSSTLYHRVQPGSLTINSCRRLCAAGGQVL